MIPPRDVIEETKRRYAATIEEQKQTLALIHDNRRSEADDVTQRAKRRRRLLSDPVVRETIERTNGLTEAVPTLPQAVFERVIGGDNFLSVAFLSLGIRASRTVACLHVADGSMGTGFMVSPELMLTNHHVLPLPEGVSGSSAVFNFEKDENRKPLPTSAFDLDPERFFLNSEELDYALVAVRATSRTGAVPLSHFGYNRLSAAEGKAMEGEKVNIIQHPNGAVKQLALQDNDITKRLPNFIQYVADTMPGSSGSPVFNNQWEVIALHHSGAPAVFEDGPNQGEWMSVDGDVWQEFMGEDKIKWLANEGVRISRIMKDITRRLGELTEAQQQLANTLLKAVPAGERAGPSVDEIVAPVIPPPVNPQPAPPEPEQDAPARKREPAPLRKAAVEEVAESITLKIPVEITVRLGTPHTGVAAPAAVNPPVDPGDVIERVVPVGKVLLESGVRIVANYEDRRGYDPKFLGTDLPTVPLPVLTPEQITNASVNRQPAAGMPQYVLPYYDYSVVMNKTRRLALFVASNVSGEPSLRPEIGDREGDAWYPDPRIPLEEQTSNANYGRYRNTRTSIDRGHLNRYMDTAWGVSVEAALNASYDTFHFTNCSPQHQRFNRNRMKWLGLEEYVLRNVAGGRRVLVFTGPIFADTDPTLKEVQVPLEYWKIVVCRRRTDGKLSAGGFRVRQDDLIRELLAAGGVEEAFQISEYQVKISELIARTGLDFAHLLPYDRYAQSGRVGLEEAARPALPLTDLSDVVM